METAAAAAVAGLFTACVVALCGLTARLLSQIQRQNGHDLLIGTLSHVGLALLTMSASIAYYRLFSRSHPLHDIPGPFFARLSQLWLYFRVINGQTRRDIQAVHKKYGDVVRIGPNEVSCAYPEAVLQIHGAKSWIKGASYSQTASGISKTETSLISLRTHAEHTVRRKLWDKAFAMATLKYYEPVIASRTQEFCKEMTTREGQVVDLHHWLGLYVWDVMSDLAYGGGGTMLQTGEDMGGALHSLCETLAISGQLKVLPWIQPLYKFLPRMRQLVAFRELATSLFRKRSQQGSQAAEERDVFHFLLTEGKETGTKLTPIELASDSALVIAAGADTTRLVLATLFMYLCRDQERMQTLRRSIDAVLGPKDEFPTHTAIAKIPELNAYINEALRLNPPVPFANQREAPEEGAQLKEYFIPGGTQVRTACYGLQRDPRYFKDPENFVPERWLEKGDDNQAAFFPFLSGAYHCVGRNFALQEMRLIIATVLHRFDVETAPGFDTVGFEESIEDRGLLEIHKPLNVILRQRKL